MTDVTFGNPIVTPNYFGHEHNDPELTWNRGWNIDINGDGDQEILVSSGNLFDDGLGSKGPQPVVVLDFNGIEITHSTSSYLTSVPTTTLTRLFVLADFNNDGHEDLFLVNTGEEATIPFPGETNVLLLSNGNGEFEDSTSNVFQGTDFSHAAAAADFDLDGDIDIFVANIGSDEDQPGYIILNNGDGTFSGPEWMQSSTQGSQSALFSSNFNDVDTPNWVELMDVNADGAIDLYFGPLIATGGNAEVAGHGYALNDGTGNFELIVNTDLSTSLPATVYEGNVVDYSASADFDNDGDLDVIALHSPHDPADPAYFQLLRNDGLVGYTDVSNKIEGQGNGNFLETFTGAPYFQEIDFDADGDIDLVQIQPNADYSDRVFFIFENDGSGNFARISDEGFPESSTYRFADVNGDWIPDSVYTLQDYDVPDSYWTSDVPYGVQFITLQLGSIDKAVNRTGWSTDDKIAGGSKNDSLRGEGGDDSLNGNDGNDNIVAGGGSDYVLGGSGADAVWAGTGDNGNDTLYGGAGNDTLAGGAGADSLLGENNNDVLFGGSGGDFLNGGAGQDVAWAGAGSDTVWGGDGSDLFGGGSGNDTLAGGNGDDVSYGAAGNDSVKGANGNDELFGGDGNDTLTGGAGNDSIFGGIGNDRLIFGASHGDDYVGAFKTKGDNTIDLSALNLSGIGALGISQSGADVVIDTGAGTITLWNTSTSDVTAGDFIF